MKIIYILLVSFSFNLAYANSIGKETGLDLPRFVSLKSNESNMRVGPSKNYPIVIKYLKSNFPLKVIDEYDDWRKVIDFQYNSGWLHKSLIKGERNGIIISESNNNTIIYNTSGGKRVGEIEIGSIIRLNKCKMNWCLITKKDYKGWVKKEYIWGVNKSETFNISFFQTLIDYYYKSINFFEVYLE